MKFSRITRYSHCEILVKQNVVECYGFDKKKFEEEMFDLTIKNEYPIAKNGKNCKKSKGKSIKFLKDKLVEKEGKGRDLNIVFLN